jgi:hypothetical protein
MTPRVGEPERLRAKKEAFPETVMVTKTQKRVFEFFGDLRRRPYFVFYKLREVLIPEFGDLIHQIGGDYLACGREGSEVQACIQGHEKSTRRIFGPSGG